MEITVKYAGILETSTFHTRAATLVDYITINGVKAYDRLLPVGPFPEPDYAVSLDVGTNWGPPEIHFGDLVHTPTGNVGRVLSTSDHMANVLEIGIREIQRYRLDSLVLI